MAEELDRHRACVAVFMRSALRDATPTQVVALLDRALCALWQRAQVTLGDVTVAAIVDRVLYTAAARYPALDALKVEPGGVRVDELSTRCERLEAGELAQAAQFVLVEFLTVLGHLTAEILTPALHSELARVPLDDLARAQPDEPTQLDAARKKAVRSS
jgi:hypothetical protein